MINTYFFGALQNTWSQSGYYYLLTPIRNAFRFIRGLSPEFDFPQHTTKGGKGISSSKSPCTELVLETLELEIHENLGGEGGTQLLRGLEI